jgi:2-keto-4-pentenoate hydratase
MTASSPIADRLSEDEIAALAAQLWDAEQRAVGLAPLTDSPRGLHPDDAYPVQLAVVAIRERLGHQVVGKKIGLTSKAMQGMVGVDEPDYGHLFDRMWIADGGAFRRSDLVQPKVEPELAFVLSRDLPGWVTPPQVLSATAFVSPALEIVDSRVADWRIKWADTVADNGSSARFVLSEQGFSPLGVDLRSVEIVFSHNGAVASTAPLSEVLASPLRSVCWLARKLADHGIALRAGDVILSGSPCRAVDAEPGDEFVADVSGMGRVSVSVV